MMAGRSGRDVDMFAVDARSLSVVCYCFEECHSCLRKHQGSWAESMHSGVVRRRAMDRLLRGRKTENQLRKYR